MRESQIERYLCEQVKQMGGEVRKAIWMGRRGCPDRLVMLPVHAVRFGRWASCRTIFVELKRKNVEPESWQLREHKRMRAMGQTVVVIDSIEGVDDLLA